MSALDTAPAWLATSLRRIGAQWPDGDAQRLAAAGTAWLDFGNALSGLRQRADSAAGRVWDANQGATIEAFRSWWTGAEGPNTNLANAEQAAQLVGTALHAASTLLSNTRSALTAQVAPAAPTLISTDPAAQARAAALIPPLSMAAAHIEDTAEGLAEKIGQLFREARDLLKPARACPVKPGSPPKLEPLSPRPDPTVAPPPSLLPKFDRFDRPACKNRPSAPWSPDVQGGADWRTARRGGILRIKRVTLPGGEQSSIIDGIVQDRMGYRMGYEEELYKQRDGMGLPGNLVDAAHLWGPTQGDEAAEGIMLAPIDANRSLTERMNNWLQSMSDTVKPYGGWVELHAVATSQAPSAWSAPNGSPAYASSGTYLLNELDYTATVCVPGNPPVVLPPVGLHVQPPYMGANGQPQMGPTTFYGGW